MHARNGLIIIMRSGMLEPQCSSSVSTNAISKARECEFLVSLHMSWLAFRFRVVWNVMNSESANFVQVGNCMKFTTIEAPASVLE
ncbi:uncharacterized protein G2W53_002812 [Senna tora]|uniref:Uncharacterized protein n=1 Tax=Senna tora TaxID=362788 RepID=A0A834XAI7_9FABA|nr:uncharacterized protein G2W53_002812 [Senna tora]